MSEFEEALREYGRACQHFGHQVGVGASEEKLAELHQVIVAGRTAALAFVHEWLPMDTAPKDGSIVLGFFPNLWVPGGDLTDPQRTWGICCIRWDGYDDRYYWHAIDGDIFHEDPAAWMPQPNAPY